MKKVAFIIGILIFSLLGCTKETITDLSGGDSRNLKKSGTVTFELKDVKLQNHPTATPGVYRISGNISHMGLIDPQSTLTIMPLGPDPEHPGFMLQQAFINMIGADGSRLHFISTKAIFSMAKGYGEQEWVIDSGTGRFEGANGWYKSTSQFDFAAGINNVNGTGEVTVNKK